MAKKIKEKSDKEIYEALIEYSRVCPQPEPWCKLFEMLEDNQNKELKIPLILNGWIISNVFQKNVRFKQHLKWAYDHGQIKEIDKYLRSLPKEDWY